MCGGHTRPEMDVEKARLIHQCSGRSKRWRYETASRGSRALTAPALKSLGSWLILSRCWGGCADTETINTLRNLAKAHISCIANSPFRILSPMKKYFEEAWARPLFLQRRSNNRLHCFFSHVIKKMLFCRRVQNCLVMSCISNANSWPFPRKSSEQGFCIISTCSGLGSVTCIRPFYHLKSANDANNNIKRIFYIIPIACKHPLWVRHIGKLFFVHVILKVKCSSPTDCHNVGRCEICPPHLSPHWESIGDSTVACPPCLCYASSTACCSSS